MSDVTWINGRHATEDEALDAAHGYDCARARDLELLAGVTGTGVRPEVPERVGDRLVTDVGWDLQLQGRKGTS